MPSVSPLAPKAVPALPPVAGVRLAALACGVRYKNRTDVCLIELIPGTSVAGVLTRSLTASAPVDICRKHLTGGKACAALINSGNANRSEEHTSELQSLMRISYAVFCLKKNTQ